MLLGALIINKKGIFYIAIAAILFGMMPICAKAIYAGGGNSCFLSFLRFALALPAIFLADIFQKRGKGGRRQPLQSWMLKQVLFLSCGLAATPLLLFWSYSYISSALATTLHFVYPLFVLIICAIIFHDRVSNTQLLCCALCTVGVSLLCSPQNKYSLLGAVLAILSGITYSIYIVWLAKSGLQDKLREYQLLFYLQMFSSILLLLINIALGTISWQMPVKIWLMCFLFALGVSVATFLFQKGTKLCGPQYAAILSVLEPVTSTVLGVLLLNESLTFRTIIGILCILLITILIARKKEAYAEET